MVGNTMVAPAPGSPEKTSVLAVGARGERVPSPAARQGVQGRRIIYADVHRTGKNGEGFRITYTTDGVAFKHVDNFTDIPAKAGDKVFVDVLPLQHTDGAIELLRCGVEVYYLRRTTLIAKRREEMKLPKSARGDIKALMSIEERLFRKVSEDFLVMRRRMIAAYRSLMKTRQQLINKAEALSENERDTLKPAIKTIEEQIEVMAAKIAEESGRRYPAYDKLVDELGIRGGLSSMEVLAELLTYVDFVNSPLRRLKKLLGLYKPVRSRKKKQWRIYDGGLRQALNRLAVSYYGTIPNGRMCWQLTRRLKELLTPQTQG